MYIIEVMYPGTSVKLDGTEKVMGITHVKEVMEITHLIDMMDSLFVDMELALSFFEEARKKLANFMASTRGRQQLEQDQKLRANIERQYKEKLGEEAYYRDYDNLSMQIELEIQKNKWQDGVLPRKYILQLPWIYAHSFLFSLDSLGKFLDVLAKDEKLSKVVRTIRDDFYTALPPLKEIRNSATHREDRSRGLDRNSERLKLQPVNTPTIHMSNDSTALMLGTLNGNKLGYTINNGSFQEIEISQTTLIIAHKSLQKLIDSFKWEGPRRFTPQ